MEVERKVIVRKLNFRQKLFLYYSLIVFIIILSGYTFVYLYIADRLKTEMYQNMELSAKEITGQLDNKVKEMDRLTIEVVSNPFIQEYMQSLKKSGVSKRYSDMQNMASNTLISISAVNLGSLRVSIYNDYGSYTSIGIPDKQSVINERTKSENYGVWYKSILPERNSSIKMLPHDDFWGSNEKMISVVREIVDINSYTSYGLVEVQYPVEKLEELFEEIPEQKQYIISKEGENIYAAEDIEKEILQNVIECQMKDEQARLELRVKGKKNYICVEKSQVTDWYIVTVRDDGVLNKSIFPVVGVALLIAAVLLIVMIVFTGLVANRLTQPLQKLRKRIQFVEEDDYKDLPDEVRNRDEIDLIDNAFESLYKTLQLSRNELAYVRLQEAKTQMLAVQAQMNPHFLYNILSVISMIAMEYQATEIMDICKYLSNMLRYAGSFSINMVSLEEEINHTENYLKLMKCRFKESVNYEIRKEEGTDNLRVPKLILQPIVENCFQHGLKGIKPPWNIMIEIGIKQKQWFIRVSDNGRGFCREEKERLIQQLENWQDNLSDDIVSLGIGGYGLRNVIIRLKIAYGNDCIFSIYEKSGKKGEYCTVEIGGEINV